MLSINFLDYDINFKLTLLLLTYHIRNIQMLLNPIPDYKYARHSHIKNKHTIRPVRCI